ncbi:hypothetical protein [Methylobrevis pamukkalensis]|uniref:Patatin-like phospholipase n=1 Tax=Methylobrevis pamukkalensis TaxID=1439726 RepID=A0A1E3H177_9HYPH|nr:hypothetical protein [Methylobrevis pamukkalensis]ODN70060.1 hypothetical protein A6302_02600 [Methylobrevis pamukkalensis]
MSIIGVDSGSAERPILLSDETPVAAVDSAVMSTMRETGEDIRIAGVAPPGLQDAAAADLPRIFLDERQVIARRRTRMASKAQTERSAWPEMREPATEPAAMNDLVGIALSGGGIRSSTFCLGVLQALHQFGVIDRADYLSTVSGGGYIGTSLTATSVASGGDFVYSGSRPRRACGMKAPAGMTSAEIGDTRAIGHLRDHSKYLAPHGGTDLLRSLAVIARGLAANLVLILWFPFLVAALTVVFNPTRKALTTPDVFGREASWLPAHTFAFSLLCLGVAILLFYLWAVWRSKSRASKSSSDISGWIYIPAAGVLILLLVIAFFEFQPYAIELLFSALPQPPTFLERIIAALGLGKPDGSGNSLLTWFGLLLAPLSAVVTFYRKHLEQIIGTVGGGGLAPMFKRLPALAMLWVGALAVPLIIWIFYVHLCFWGIADTAAKEAFGHSPAWFLGLRDLLWPDAWTDQAAQLDYKSAFALLLIAVILLGLGLPLGSNANSLHALYRDRLADAFHFDPSRLKPGNGKPTVDITLAGLAVGNDLDLTPYPLVNTAVNLQSSREANRRGRNADFFLFSPLYVGSRATGYLTTSAFSTHGESLRLASVMAISGAAASSNMGRQTLWPLTPTLTILNIRLGYWLTNPRQVAKVTDALVVGTPANVRTNRRLPGQFYFGKEMLGRLTEKAAKVYLTDGGHIENLGIYELLRRKCRVIIAVDAEADPDMRFGSFITLQMYARIDLGIRIDLPVAALREATEAVRTGVAAPRRNWDPPPAHVAVGEIDYGGGVTGVLVYIKASLTGDENDYIRDYHRRFPAFPQEQTSDQFFSEEQFEVYRALGFHAADRFFGGEDAAGTASNGPSRETINGNSLAMTTLRATFG